MQQQKSTTNLYSLAIFFSLMLFTFCSSPLESETSNDNNFHLVKVLMNTELEELTPQEITGLIFMREEEKLARDVYSLLYNKWNKQIFKKISRSEQRHTDAIKIILDRYGIEDPVAKDEIGVFNNEMLQNLYKDLVERGNKSLFDALKVGAAIEEIDILDLEDQINNIVDNEDVNFVYNNLIRGSRNHLRAFVKNISSLDEQYTPQYLTEEKFNEIINDDMERGGQFRRKGKGRRG